MKKEKKLSFIKKIRIAKEKYGFQLGYVSGSVYELKWHKWEDFCMSLEREHITLCQMEAIGKLFNQEISMVFPGMITDGKLGLYGSIRILVKSENTVWKKSIFETLNQ